MVSYHVTLGGQGLMLDLVKYERRAAAAFVRRTATGERGYGDLSVEQVLALSDWSGGEGRDEYLSAQASRYRSGSGADGYTVPGTLRVGPGLQGGVAGAEPGWTVLASYGGKLYGGTTAGKVFVQDPVGTWTVSVDLAKAAGITAMAVFKGELFVANGTDAIVASFNGSVWTAARFTVTAPTTKVLSLGVADRSVPNLYTGASHATAGELHRWNGSTISANLYSVQEADITTVALLGTAMYFTGADLAGKRGTIYKSNAASGSEYDLVYHWPDNYPLVAVVWDGSVYYGMAVGGELWKWDGSSASLVARDLTAAGDELRGLAVWDGALWVSSRNGSEVRAKRLGSGGELSEPAGGGAVAASANRVRGLVVLNDLLYLAGQNGPTSSPVYRLEAGVYRTTPVTVESPVHGLGLPALDKVFLRATLQHGALVASQSVELQYRVEDTGAWTSLGTSSTVGATSATLAFAAGVVGKLIGLRLVLTGTAVASPSVSEVAVSYVPSPDVKREWSLEALFEGTAALARVTLDGEPDPLTGAGQSAAVWVVRLQDGPVSFVDLDGVSRQVWFLELEETVAKQSQRLGYSTRAKLRLVEA